MAASHLMKRRVTRTERAAQKRKRWLLQLVPGAHEQRSLEALSTGLSGLALPNQAVSLELAGVSAARGVRRSFLARTQTLEGRTHLTSQFQELYAQAELSPVDNEEDPLQVGEDEEVSCLEMRLGAPSYLPLRTWQRKVLTEEGNDPLLGVLAALKHLPPRFRAVVQVVLSSAPDTWSHQAQRLAQQHPLEEERERRQVLARALPRTTPAIENELFLEVLGAAVVLFLVGYWVWKPLHALLPAWLWQAVGSLLHGQSPHLAPGQIVVAGLLLLGGLIPVGAFGWLYLWLKRLWWGQSKTRTMYDPALVRQKTERIAYQGVVRLYVIGPRPGPSVTRRKPRPRVPLRKLVVAWGMACGAFCRKTWWQRHLSWLWDRNERKAWGNPWWRDSWRVWKAALGWRSVWATLANREQSALAWSRAQWLLFLRRRRAARERRKVLDRLVASLHSYHLASGNFFVPRRCAAWLVRRRLEASAKASRVLARPRWYARKAYFTPEEVGSLYHLLQDADLRNRSFVERRGARTLPVPWQLAAGSGEPFGRNVHAGVRTPVFFPQGGLGYNLLALAGTGKGKSSLFAHLARVLFADPVKRGAVLVDPHGDLARAFLGCVPTARQDEVVYLNLGDSENPVGLNFLDMSNGQNRDKIVDMWITIFKKWWGQNWGSRIENTLQYCLLTLCEVNRSRCRADAQLGPSRQCTILSIVPLLTNSDYREALLKEFKDSDIWTWWNTYYKRQRDAEQLEIAASVITKISKFRANKVIRRIVGQPVSSISISEIVKNSRILIVNTAASTVGDDTSTLCGSMILGLLRTSIAEQGGQDQADRPPIFVFLDEMQHYIGVDLNGMLAELRKCGGNFALATQSFAYLDALDKTIKPTLLSNTDQLFAFDMGADDAAIMAKEIGGDIEPNDILSLANFSSYARLTEAGERLPTFSVQLLPPPQGDASVRQAIVSQSQAAYGRPKAAVDKALRHQDRTRKDWLQATPPPSSEPLDEDGLLPDYEAIERDAWQRQTGQQPGVATPGGKRP